MPLGLFSRTYGSTWNEFFLKKHFPARAIVLDLSEYTRTRRKVWPPPRTEENMTQNWFANAMIFFLTFPKPIQLVQDSVCWKTISQKRTAFVFQKERKRYHLEITIRGLYRWISLQYHRAHELQCARKRLGWKWIWYFWDTIKYADPKGSPFPS